MDPYSALTKISTKERVYCKTNLKRNRVVRLWGKLSKFEQTELPAKLLVYFSWSNKSNINQMGSPAAKEDGNLKQAKLWESP